MATADDYSADNPFLQAERSFLDPRMTTSGIHEPRENDDYSAWEVAAGATGVERSQSETPVTPAAGSSVAAPGITATQSSHEVDGRRFWGGCDKLEFTTYGGFGENYSDLCLKFEEGRLSASVGQGSSLVEILGAALRMAERGHRWGNTVFQWVGEYNGIKYSFGRAGQSDKCAVAKVEVSSLALMMRGHQACFDEAMMVLGNAGVLVERTNLYRIDFCLDVAGQATHEYGEALRRGEVISRVKSEPDLKYGRDGRCFYAATGNRKGVRVKFYDKVRELNDKPGWESELKRAVLVQTRWGSLPAEALRCEFEVRGAWLKDRFDGMESVQEVLNKLPSVMEYLVQNYFRIVDGQVDRENKNQQRVEMAPIWKRLVNGFTAVLGAGEKLVRCTKSVEPDVERVIRKALRPLMKVAALAGPEKCRTKVQALQIALNILSGYSGDDEFVDGVREIHDEMRAKGLLAAYTTREWPSTRFALIDHLVPF